MTVATYATLYEMIAFGITQRQRTGLKCVTQSFENLSQ